MMLILNLLGSSPALATLSVRAQVQALSFISADYVNTSDRNFMLAGVSLLTRVDDRKNPPVFFVNAEGALAVGQPVLNFLNVKEVYFLQRHENTFISYGRRKAKWSGLDDAWNLGFFQPQFRWNSIDPQTQGQTGIFFQSSSLAVKQSGFLWMIFGSPLFLPDQGPSFELKEGQFSSSNPWFKSPPQQIEFSGQTFPIDYNVTMPRNEDVVLQSTYGLQVGLQSDNGLYLKGAYLSTPSHQAAINYKAVLVAGRVRVDFTPKFYREQNFSLDIGYRKNKNSLSFFFLSNQPEPVEHAANFNYAEVQPSTAWGPQGVLESESFKIYANGLFIHQGEVVEKGPDAGQVSTPLTTKYIFRSAYQLGAGYQGESWSSLLEWTESFKDSLKFLKVKNQFQFSADWKAFLDILLVDTASGPSSVLHLQNLDQVWGGVSYEF